MKRWFVLILLLSSSLFVATAQGNNARVIEMWNTLNMRQTPGVASPVIAEIPGSTSLTAVGRTASNRWYQVQFNGQTGWVSADYVELIGIAQSSLPIVQANVAPSQNTQNTQNAQNAQESVEAPQSQAISPTQTNGRIIASILNVRTQPSTNAAVVARLSFGARVGLVGRTADDIWVQIQTVDGVAGWVATAFVDEEISLSSLPVLSGAVPVAAAPDDTGAQTDPPQALTDPAAVEPPFFTLGANSWSIRATGIDTGKRAQRFSKIGDSITASPLMYRPFGYHAYRLGDYGYLQPTINYFAEESFTRQSLAAQNGWTTAHVLNPQNANKSVCRNDESPIQCEYRVHQPAVALIMFGTNDVSVVPDQEFAQNMSIIVELSRNEGVIPVLSTIPPRRGYEPQTAFYNELIIQIASRYGVSLWDYGAVMRSLPDAGLSSDGVHPSEPAGGFQNAANFTGDLLRSGYVQRNLTALQSLDVIRRRVLQ